MSAAPTTDESASRVRDDQRRMVTQYWCLCNAHYISSNMATPPPGSGAPQQKDPAPFSVPGV